MGLKTTENWTIRKPAVASATGMVASQHFMASDVGASILASGGNAVDAAIATGLALGVVEPWMSGLGGGGYMTVYLASEDRVRVIDFGMRAPFDACQEDYPLAASGTNSSDAFNWPQVKGDANVEGPLSIAVPGYLRGIELALEQFGTCTWKALLEPACHLAERGLPIDWFSAQKINQWARPLNRYAETRRTYLSDGLPPVARLDGCFDFIPLGNLASTLRSIQTEGSRAFYAGSLTASICQDLATAGSRISAEDLASYEAHVTEPLSTDYRGAQLYVSGNLTAGPSIIQALDELQRQWSPGGSPDADTYIAYARALRSTYEYRLNSLGEGHDGDNPGNTSHVCVADSQGNVVSLTQTIMSAFGSRVMLPGTGILMNNGMMWFDPRPGGPNAIVGGRRPLCNMCPVILKGADESVTAIGACGGRKIFPAVFQLTSFLTDFGMDVDTAVHTPRLDVSGTDLVTLMSHLEEATISRLQREFTHVVVRDNGVNPNLFALPQIIRLDRQGHASGGCFVPSPHAAVSLPASG